MSRSRTPVAVLAVTSAFLVLLPPSARAQTHLVANLTNEAESPPATPLLTSTGDPRPKSFGHVRFVLSADQQSLFFTAFVHNIDVTGLQTPDTNDDLRAAHIHAPINPTTNTGPVIWGFFGSPFNDLVAPVTALTPFEDAVGGIFSGTWNASEGNNTTLTAQLPAILSGQAYINFHTVQFPGGEIRGTIQVTPEPVTLVLLGTGLVVVAAARRRRHREATEPS